MSVVRDNAHSPNVRDSEHPTAEEMYECGHEGIDFLQRWMRTPNPQFGGEIPLVLMLSGRGHKVAQYIQDAYECSKPGETP